MPTVFFNGTVITQDQRNPVVSAFSVENGLITATGKDHDFNLGGATRVDLRGKTVLPGFNDAHIHLWKVGQLSDYILDLRGIDSIAAMIERVKEASRTVEPGRWIIGRGFNEAVLTEKRLPVATDLDRATTRHPVYLLRTCAHIACLNSEALKVCRITPRTISPEGGLVGMKDGLPNGQFYETALGLITSHIPPTSVDDLGRMIRIAARQMLAAGITSMTDPAVHPELGWAYQLACGEKLGLRVNLMPMLLPDGGEITYPLPEVHTDPWRRQTTVKLFADGGLSGGTAALSRNYRNRDDRGILRIGAERFLSLGREIRSRGFAIGTHAIGDRAIGQVLESYRTLEEEFAPVRNRIEHFALPTDAALREAARQGTIAVPQPVFLDELGDNFLASLDDDFLKRCYPIKTLSRYGIRYALSSDAPVVKNFDPWNNIRAAVTRKTRSGKTISPEEAITVSEALASYTMGGAWAEGTEAVKGSIEPEKYADFIVLDRNPLETPVEELTSIVTESVFVNGQQVYSRN
jgi:predicted amidohydrolase YtcJ